MKIGIVTITDYTNYGNRLQNYALTILLKGIADEVVSGFEGYSHQDWINDETNIIKKIIKYITPYQYQKRKVKQYAYNELMKERISRFKIFTNEYTYTFPYLYFKNNSDLRKQINEASFDYFIVGSDQVWNPIYQGKSYEFLRFTDKNKRYSFAASISAEEIPPSKRSRFARYIADMNYISVREERAADIVKKLTGRTADVTLDPTLLLDKTDWECIAKKPELYIESKYICTYFLGEVPEAVKAFAKEKGLLIYALNSLDSPELYTLDPAEFLYMIQNASYVLTDSFHAVAFSIKFNKEFYVFDRKQDGVSSMFSRIETITKRFGLENRIQNRDRIVDQEPVSNWNEIEKELVAEKKRSMGKLLEAMGI